jgi:hypothetical protein
MGLMFSSYGVDFPPAFAGQPVLYMLTVFSLLLVNLLALEWLWRTGWALWEDSHDFRHPLTIQRIVILLLVLGAVIRSGPDVIVLMRYHAETEAGRLDLYRLDNFLDSVAFIPFSLAWLVAYLAGPMLAHQLAKEPIPLHLWPTWAQIKRPVKIGVGVFAIAFALTYLR